MDKGMEESILRPTCDARDQSLALGEAGGVDRLTDLLARIEAAPGPDRDIDGELWCALIPTAADTDADLMRMIKAGEPLAMLSEIDADWRGHRDWVPAYTGSLDAALALLGRALSGWAWCARTDEASGAYCNVWDASSEPNNGAPCWPAYAKTPPLAVCAALLRALIAQEQASA